MLEIFRRCFQGDVLGFCSKKGTAKYVDFGAEGQGKNGVSQLQDLEWDADIDALTEMEYNLVAEQPKGIKLELQEAESIPTPRGSESGENAKETTSPESPELPESPGEPVEPTSQDVENHNELSDFIAMEPPHMQKTKI